MKIEALVTDETPILVSGDRNWFHDGVVSLFLSNLSSKVQLPVIIHGWAAGLDTLAAQIATDKYIRSVPCPPHWDHVFTDKGRLNLSQHKWLSVHGKCEPDCKMITGKPAGVIRNTWMLDTYHPKEVHGFHDNIEQSKGTKHMLNYAVRKKIPTFLHMSDSSVISITKYI